MPCGMVEAGTREYRLASASPARRFPNGEVAGMPAREGKCI